MACNDAFESLLMIFVSPEEIPFTGLADFENLFDGALGKWLLCAFPLVGFFPVRPLAIYTAILDRLAAAASLGAFLLA